MGESFFKRWSKRKTEHIQQTDAAKPHPTQEDIRQENSSDRAVHSLHGSATEKALPTIEDVAKLSNESDYSLFVAKGVDKNVRRAAMKKLFSDPHFNVMDGLDIYIDDYTKPSPLTPAMLAALNHTKNLFGPAQDPEESQERAKEKDSAELTYANGSTNTAALCDQDHEPASQYDEKAEEMEQPEQDSTGDQGYIPRGDKEIQNPCNISHTQT